MLQKKKWNGFIASIVLWKSGLSSLRSKSDNGRGVDSEPSFFVQCVNHNENTTVLNVFPRTMT